MAKDTELTIEQLEELKFSLADISQAIKYVGTGVDFSVTELKISTTLKARKDKARRAELMIEFNRLVNEEIESGRHARFGSKNSKMENE